MSWLPVLAGILLVVASGVSGSLALLYRGYKMRQYEQAYGLTTPYLQHISGGIGAIMGLIIGGIAVYYLSLNQQASLIEWIGRFSYVLVTAASGGHLLVLVHTAFHLVREELAWKKRGPEKDTLGGRRVNGFKQLSRQHQHYIDRRFRDEAVVEELIGVLGNALLATRRNLNRLPFYGYLGTICGILLMAEELSKINEATETFKVLSSMAHGLVLAFQTTLVALAAYLPLRKATDYLIQRLGALEDDWIKLREEWGEVGE